MPHKVICVAGARPNFVKIAPIMRTLVASPLFAPKLVHTGQHRDPAMSGVFFEELHIPLPDISLDVGPGSHAAQTGLIMSRFEGVLESEQPEVVIVVGDVNSTVACALAAAKHHNRAPLCGRFPGGRRRPILAHVEAGLRSFDDDMPEEINRRVADTLSDVLFVSEPSGLANLRNEGVRPERVFFVGNVMIDTLLAAREAASRSTILSNLGLTAGSYGLLTLHRPSNVDDPAQLLPLLEVLDEIARRIPLVFPVHPRTASRFEAIGAHLPAGRWKLVPPAGYLDFMKLLSSARLVLTDSGGVQEESTMLGVRCLTLRESTERPATLTDGTNLLAGARRETILPAFERAMASPPEGRVPELWDGCAAERIADTLRQVLSEGRAAE